MSVTEDGEPQLPTPPDAQEHITYSNQSQLPGSVRPPHRLPSLPAARTPAVVNPAPTGTSPVADATHFSEGARYYTRRFFIPSRHRSRIAPADFDASEAGKFGRARSELPRSTVAIKDDSTGDESKSASEEPDDANNPFRLRAYGPEFFRFYGAFVDVVMESKFQADLAQHLLPRSNVVIACVGVTIFVYAAIVPFLFVPPNLIAEFLPVEALLGFGCLVSAAAW
ncbi:hypothetical protein HK405_014506, partial [Cladochytrium tenue]